MLYFSTDQNLWKYNEVFWLTVPSSVCHQLLQWNLNINLDSYFCFSSFLVCRISSDTSSCSSYSWVKVVDRKASSSSVLFFVPSKYNLFQYMHNTNYQIHEMIRTNRNYLKDFTIKWSKRWHHVEQKFCNLPDLIWSTFWQQIHILIVNSISTVYWEISW